MFKRIPKPLIAASVAGSTTAIWFALATIRLVYRMSGGWRIPPFWLGIFDFWFPVLSAGATGALTWLVISRLVRVPVILQGIIAGTATALLAPILFWRVLVQGTFLIPGIGLGNLDGFIALQTYKGSWPYAVVVGAVVGGLLGWRIRACLASLPAPEIATEPVA